MLIEELKNTLDNHFDTNNLNEGDLRKILSRLVETYDLIQMLDQLSEHPDPLSVIDRAYSHDNGFDKIVLVNSSKYGYKLRLHFWDSNLSRVNLPQENIHNHRWDFASYILAGEYYFEIYEETNQYNNRYKYKYYSPEKTSGYQLEDLGESGVRCVFQTNLGAGTLYEITHDVLHRVSNLDRISTVTFMLQGSKQKNYTHVFASTNLSTDEDVPVADLSSETLRARLSSIRSILVDRQGTSKQAVD